MDLGGRHIFLIGMGLYFLHKTVGVRLARSIESFQIGRRLRKDRDNREKKQKEREKELRDMQKLQDQLDSLRIERDFALEKWVDSNGDSDGEKFVAASILQERISDVKSQIGSIKGTRVLINISRIALPVLLILALCAPSVLGIVGNFSSIPGYSILGVGSQGSAGEWILGRLLLGGIIFAIGAVVESNSETEQAQSFAAILWVFGGLLIITAVWIFVCIWIHQLWNGSEEWWAVLLGIIITGWIRNKEHDWRLVLSENPP